MVTLFHNLPFFFYENFVLRFYVLLLLLDFWKQCIRTNVAYILNTIPIYHLLIFIYPLGDKDEESVERRLEEAKARLPLRFGKEAERLRHYGDVKEWGTENEKEKADEEMSKSFQQNEDKKLEGKE